MSYPLIDLTLAPEEIVVLFAALDLWIGQQLRLVHEQGESDAARHTLAVAEVLRQRLLDACG